MADEMGEEVLLSLQRGECKLRKFTCCRIFKEDGKNMDLLPPLPVVADWVYNSVELLKLLRQLGAKPCLQMKGTWQYDIKHPL